jgi:hypothetical protein
MYTPHLPDTGRLSIPIAAHRPDDGYALIFCSRGTTYCFRDDLARKLTKKGWSLAPEPTNDIQKDDLPF